VAFSHMPPHGALGLPLRTETLASSSLSDPAVTIIPENQLLDSVTPLTTTPVL